MDQVGAFGQFRPKTAELSETGLLSVSCFVEVLLATKITHPHPLPLRNVQVYIQRETLRRTLTAACRVLIAPDDTRMGESCG